jgi:hypothetical protein
MNTFVYSGLREENMDVLLGREPEFARGTHDILCSL